VIFQTPPFKTVFQKLDLAYESEVKERRGGGGVRVVREVRRGED